MILSCSKVHHSSSSISLKSKFSKTSWNLVPQINFIRRNSSIRKRANPIYEKFNTPDLSRFEGVFKKIKEDGLETHLEEFKSLNPDSHAKDKVRTILKEKITSHYDKIYKEVKEQKLEVINYEGGLYVLDEEGNRTQVVPKPKWGPELDKKRKNKRALFGRIGF